MAADTPATEKDPIRHVVMLMLENHSFDQMLGCFKQVYPDLDGVDPTAPPDNHDSEGRIYPQAETTERIMFLDPHHEVEHVQTQLSDHNSGFVRDFETAFGGSNPDARTYVMGYYPLDFLPGLHTLAHHFTICDQWFSSLPGPTWPNRFFALTGTSNGRVNMPGDGTHKADLPGFFQQTQDTLFDRLNDRAIHWKVYFHDIPQTTVLAHQREPHNVARYFYIDEFFDDARGHEDEFPQFCLIEPAYTSFAENDDYPPHDIMRSQKLIVDVYNTLRTNDPLWKSTLLVVFYDEHGGFYDHVEPPAAVAPDNHHKEYTFDRLGVRVPALLVSPWVDARVEHTLFDHTSVLRYLSDKWGLDPLGRRTASANSVAAGLMRQTARNDGPIRIELSPEQLRPPNLADEEQVFGYASAHQTALHRLTTYLKAEAAEQVPRGWSIAARGIECAKALVERTLEYIYGEPPGMRASIAEPDKLARNTDAQARDNVARFIMRKKRYAAIGIQRRLADPALNPEQRQASLHALALISGRKFHRDGAESAGTQAEEWLRLHLGPFPKR
jgi:phospholipase C